MGQVTERLLAATKDIWDSYYTHPFVQGLADGSLDKEKFKFYMVQDYLYLLDYIKVFALGCAKAGDEEAMRYFADYIWRILDGEMDIHRGYMQRLGISREEADSTPKSLDNHSYTAYMLKAAYDGGAAEAAAAILSCAVSYEYIGRYITEHYPKAAEHELYGEWVQGYSSPDYAASNLVLEALVERLCDGFSEERLKKIEEIFVVCSRYEASFWDMAWEMRP